jgi:glycyl-tRNA synthetase beta chain
MPREAHGVTPHDPVSGSGGDRRRGELLVELGTEEIPAGFLARALVELQSLIPAKLAEARLAHGAVQIWGTPRRIALSVADLADRQPDVDERVVGPPAGAAYDKEGKPTRAAVGFAEKNGVDLAALEKTEVPGKKGQYLVCTRREPGRPAAEVLPAIVAGILGAISWPKSMRWGTPDVTFVRPVHWLVALYGAEVVPVAFGGVKAGRQSRGHRFLAPGPIELDGTAAGYLAALREAFVLVEPERRKTMIAAELARIENETGARVRPDEALLDEVTFLVEYPVAVCGTFAREFLEVPEPVVVSAMRTHQRYFAMEDGAGKLVNRFVTIAGTVTRDPAVVVKGNQKVLAARLADARFFFQEDSNTPVDTFQQRLSGVIFQKQLGTVGDKVARIRDVAADVAAMVGASSPIAVEAAGRCKTDLVTRMVGEFPDLQGTMGRYYAPTWGVSPEAAAAIEEHYMPRGSQAALPASAPGAVVAIADRMDTLVACFSVGLVPTGSADPYALRRAALGVLSILLDRGWRVSLSELVARAGKGLKGMSAKVADQVLEFMKTRLRGLLVDQQLAPDCVDAALAAGYDVVVDARARAQALSGLRARADFEPLGAAFKRVANILKGQAIDRSPDPAAFVEGEEKALWQSFGEIEGRVTTRLEDGDYAGALQVLAELKGPVDRFFDKVLVMDKDERVKANRLALLGRINATFTRIADFRQLSV